MQLNIFTERFSGGTELRHHEKREDDGRNFHGSDPFGRDPRRKSGCWQGGSKRALVPELALPDSQGRRRHELAGSPRQPKKLSPILGFRLRAGISHRLREGHELLVR